MSFFRRRVRPQLQAESAECGLACLAMLATYCGRECRLEDLRERHDPGPGGLNLDQLGRVAEGLGLSFRPLRVELGELGSLGLPAMLHWQLDHFVVLERVSRHRLCIIDPAHGSRQVRLPDADTAFTGVAVELSPAAGFVRRKARHRTRFRPLLRVLGNEPWLLVRLLFLSLALQVFLLLGPFFTQLVIDEVIPSRDRDLLVLLVTVFLSTAVLTAIAEAVRAWMLVYLRSYLGVAWSGALFRHLLLLPYRFFERRSVGDIQSRFGSLGALRDLLSRQALEALVDSVVLLPLLAIVLIYDLVLGAIVVMSVTLLCVAQSFLNPGLHASTTEAVAARARQESMLLQALRSIVAVRNFSAERLLSRQFSDLIEATVAAEAGAARYRIIKGFLARLLLGCQGVIVIAVAATAVLDGRFTVGMTVAFLAYSGQFVMRATAMLDRYFEFRVGRVHLERFADISETRPERIQYVAPVHSERAPASVRIEGLGFRYSTAAAWTFRHVSISVAAGEHVVITGPSGCGKSTLLKILAGLNPPEEGTVYIDGDVLGSKQLARHRQRTGVVMQDDVLLRGSLLQNITFFDDEPDTDEVGRICEQVGLSDCLASLPLGIRAPVGDIGSSLSGGQRQRVLLARALYRRPRLLLLDEASSHLDPESERQVSNALRDLCATRIVIAHRRCSILAADREIYLPDCIN